MKIFLQRSLAFFARKIVAKYKPTIIGITGSVGKTSVKEAIFLIVSQKYKAYRPGRNLNNEFGLPLAIIGKSSPGRSFFGWLGVMFKAVRLILIKQKYPEVLVLEYGIDRVGDMDYLLSIAKPNIGVITTIGVSHYEYFKDEKVIEHEKGRIVEVLTADDVAILNSDDTSSVRQRERTSAKVITYGAGEGADVRAENIQESYGTPYGTSFTAVLGTRKIPVRIPVFGRPHISSILSALAVADALEIETSLISNGLSRYKPVSGRLNLISGIKRSTIIDDTYNAAPSSMEAALQLFARMPSKHKVAVLGDMLELGSLSDEAHKKIGNLLAEISPEHLVTVGPSGKIIAEGALAAGFPEERIVSFDSSLSAAQPVQDLVKEGSLVLVKGSQGIRMEKIVKEIMAEPMRAQELLCRQYGKWLNS